MTDEPISDRWPHRLKSSASLLCQTSLELQTALLDERRFRLLTDQGPTSEQAVAEYRAFNRLLVTALTSLIDLTAYDNPDQDYLTSGGGLNSSVRTWCTPAYRHVANLTRPPHGDTDC